MAGVSSGIPACMRDQAEMQWLHTWQDGVADGFDGQQAQPAVGSTTLSCRSTILFMLVFSVCVYSPCTFNVPTSVHKFKRYYKSKAALYFIFPKPAGRYFDKPATQGFAQS